MFYKKNCHERSLILKEVSEVLMHRDELKYIIEYKIKNNRWPKIMLLESNKIVIAMQ